jgi:hypothetical protein
LNTGLIYQFDDTILNFRLVSVNNQNFKNENDLIECSALIDGRKSLKMYRCVFGILPRIQVLDITDPDSKPPDEWIISKRYLILPDPAFGTKINTISTSTNFENIFHFYDIWNDLLLVGYKISQNNYRMLIYNLLFESIFPIKSQGVFRYSILVRSLKLSQMTENINSEFQLCTFEINAN